MELKLAKTAEDIAFCQEAILQFRPNLKPEEVVPKVLRMMQNEQFKLVYIPNDENTGAAAFTGYRHMSVLRIGSIIYIDDLFTMPQARKRGYGDALLNYVIAEAREAGLQYVDLDSGYQRNDAHRLYLNKGFILGSHHFSLNLGTA